MRCAIDEATLARLRAGIVTGSKETPMVDVSCHSDDTIYALSTTVGKSALAVVRVSGPQCGAILKRICQKNVFKDRRATVTTILDEDRNILDRSIVMSFPAPHSFTGEDMVEFHVTGSRAVIKSLLEALANCPLTRPAEAGEFARRAFMNGKLDLAEVEGLASVVEAETRAQLRHAITSASGKLSRRCEEARALVVSAMAVAESMLDFSDVTDAEALSVDEIISAVSEASTILSGMLDGAQVSERLREGLNVVIAGRPNVGKSTLLNCLAQRDVAIVSPIAGTTRDTLELATEIGGFPVTFIDTAGLRQTVDPLESLGIMRTREKCAYGDLILWLFDNDDELRPATELGDRPVLKVRTKCDLFEDRSPMLDGIRISARSGTGIGILVARILEFACEHFAGAGGTVAGTARQAVAIRDARNALKNIQRGLPVELIAEDLRLAAMALARVVGRVEVEEVLGEIFSRLCVGK